MTSWSVVVRRRVYDRDNGICQLCFTPVEFTSKKMHADHIRQRCENGSDDMANLRTTHAACNRSRPLPEGMSRNSRYEPDLDRARDEYWSNEDGKCEVDVSGRYAFIWYVARSGEKRRHRVWSLSEEEIACYIKKTGHTGPEDDDEVTG